jgi:hypothetical protein
MLSLALLFAALSVGLGFNFYRKYEARLRSESQSILRYSRIADYFGTPISLAFEYRFEEKGEAVAVEADVDEIYHYGRDYFLKGHSTDGKRSHVYKWSRISNLHARFDGRNLDSLEALFLAADGFGSRIAA